MVKRDETQPRAIELVWVPESTSACNQLLLNFFIFGVNKFSFLDSVQYSFLYKNLFQILHNSPVQFGFLLLVSREIYIL